MSTEEYVVFLSTKHNGFIRLNKNEFDFISSNWNLEYVKLDQPKYFVLNDDKVQAVLTVNDYDILTEILYIMPYQIRCTANIRVENVTLSEKYKKYTEEYMKNHPDIIIMDVRLNNKLKDKFTRLYGPIVYYKNRESVKYMDFDTTYNNEYKFTIHVSVNLKGRNPEQRKEIVDYLNDTDFEPIRINTDIVDFNGYFKIR
ncbi:hypothetical protein [Romboutsia ilealis]|uniref:hypothetical protein n=1 Tax=Romboutsia ilealis TaxID=1115758 RepID=UPI00272C323F|nr:hypothetical protein [Romboutsia ilealis]